MKLTRPTRTIGLFLSLTLLVPNIAVAASPFKDVATDYFAYEHILNLSERGIVSGSGDGYYHPEDQMTRGEVIKVVLGAAGIAIENVSSSDFSDVPDGYSLMKEVETARVKGISSGYEDGTYKPNLPVTRGQALKLLLTATGQIQANPAKPKPFADVDDEGPYAAAIYSAFNLGIASGFNDGKFHPNDNLTRGQAAKIIYNAILLKEGKPLPGSESQYEVSDLEEYLFELINESRAAEGLSPLILDVKLSEIARAHSEDLYTSFKSFDKDTWADEHPNEVGPWITHDSGDGTTFEKRFPQSLTLFNISSQGSTENVGWATYNARSPEDAVKVIHEAMMAEVPPNDNHRQNILGQSIDTTHVGVGVVAGENPKELYVTTDFIKQ